MAEEQLIGGVLSSTLLITELSAAEDDGVYSCSLSNVADQDTHMETSTTTVTLTTLGKYLYSGQDPLVLIRH